MNQRLKEWVTQNNNMIRHIQVVRTVTSNNKEVTNKQTKMLNTVIHGDLT